MSLKFVKIVGATAPNGSEGGLLKRPCSPRAFVSYSCPGTLRRAWPLSSGGRKSQIPARAGRAPAGGSAASAPAAPRFRGLPTALRAPWLVGASLRARLHAARCVTPPLSCTRTLDGESWALWLQDPLKATGPRGAGRSPCLGQDARVERQEAWPASPPGGRTLPHHHGSALLF